jgi:hypothetical protein
MGAELSAIRRRVESSTSAQLDANTDADLNQIQKNTERPFDTDWLLNQAVTSLDRY